MSQAHSGDSSQLNFIDWEFIHRLNTSPYARSDAYNLNLRVPRAIKNKIDDLALGAGLSLNLGGSSTGSGPGGNKSYLSGAQTPGGHSIASSESPSMVYSGSADLSSSTNSVNQAIMTGEFTMDTLVRLIHGSSRSDISPTLKDLWGGKPGSHRKAREQLGAQPALAAASSPHDLQNPLAARYPNLRLAGNGGEWDDDEEKSLARIMWRETGGKMQKKGQALAHGFAEWSGYVLSVPGHH
jgi:hypothetical protein